MATVQKVREQVFLISWNTVDINTYYGHPTGQESVEISDISQSCQLSYTQPSGYNNSKGILQLNIDPIQYSSPQNPHNVRRLDRGPFSQQYRPVTYTPRFFNRDFNLSSSSENTNKKSDVLTPSNVLATINGVSQPMKLQNSKWTTEFKLAPVCRCGTAEMIINILIDFSSTSTEKESNRVLDHLLNLWETKTLSDVTFKFKDKEVKAHTLILASGSPVLAVMFQSDFKEKQERVVAIQDIKSTVFEKMIRYIYTGKPDLGVDVSELLVAANKYGVDSLKKECALYMARNLTVDNAIGFLVVSHLHESQNLYEATLEFISKNGEAIVAKKDWVLLMKNRHELSLAAVQMMVLTKKNTGPDVC